MEGSKLDGYLSRGEGLSLEFKRCGNQPGADTFETICSFANRQGGSILLGVLDDGAVEGIDARAVSAIERNIVNVVNNPDLFNVPPAIEFERITFGGGGGLWLLAFGPPPGSVCALGSLWAPWCFVSGGRCMIVLPTPTSA